MTWRESRKRALGTVWHLVGSNGRAACDSRVYLIGTTREEMPTDSYVCKRCQRIVLKRDDATGPRK